MPHKHRYILAYQSESDHAEEIYHPVDGECSVSVGAAVGETCDGVCGFGFGGDGVGAGEVDLEGEGDEGVGEGEEEVGGDCGAPAPDDEVGEF